MWRTRHIRRLAGIVLVSAALAAGCTATHHRSSPDPARLAAARVTCPARVPELRVPDRGSGHLFPQPVADVVVCGYRPPEASARRVLTGRPAAQLVASLESASTEFTPHGCAPASAERPYQLAFFALTTSGARLEVVTATLGVCETGATNGVAVRYDWSPPPRLLAVLVPSWSSPTLTHH